MRPRLHARFGVLTCHSPRRAAVCTRCGYTCILCIETYTYRESHVEALGVDEASFARAFRSIGVPFPTQGGEVCKVRIYIHIL